MSMRDISFENRDVVGVNKDDKIGEKSMHLRDLVEARFQKEKAPYGVKAASSTTLEDFNESFSDSAIRWGQNKHDGITPSAKPLRSPSTHSQYRPRSFRRRLTSTRIPPRLPSNDSSCGSGMSSATAPSRPTRVPSPPSSPTAQSGPTLYIPYTPSKDSSLSSKESFSTAPLRPQRLPSVHSSHYDTTAHSFLSLLSTPDEDEDDGDSMLSFFEGSIEPDDATVDDPNILEPNKEKPASATKAPEFLVEFAPGICLEH